MCQALHTIFLQKNCPLFHHTHWAGGKEGDASDFSGFFGRLGGLCQIAAKVEAHLTDLLFAEQERRREDVDEDGEEHGGVIAAHRTGHGLGAVQPADEEGRGIVKAVQKDQHPEVAGAEVKGRIQHPQRGGKDALHQHAEGSAGQEIGQMCSAEEEAGQDAGFPNAAAAGSKMLQQGLGDDTPEQKLLRQTDGEHGCKVPEDLRPRPHGLVVRAAKHQLGVEVIADEAQRVHPHQQAIEKAAAPAAHKAQPAGLFQDQHRHPNAEQLLQNRQEIIVQPGDVHSQKSQRIQQRQRPHHDEGEKKHFGQQAVPQWVRRAQALEHKRSLLWFQWLYCTIACPKTKERGCNKKRPAHKTCTGLFSRSSGI